MKIENRSPYAIVEQIIDDYFTNIYVMKENDYFLKLKILYLTIELFSVINKNINKKEKKLKDQNKQSIFDIEKELKKIDKRLDKTRQKLYNIWRMNKFDKLIENNKRIKNRTFLDDLRLAFFEQYIKYDSSLEVEFKKDLGW